MLCLSLKAFFLATKQLRAVGIPVVVRAIQIIKKLNTKWYIPRWTSDKLFDRNILYKKPITLTIKLDKKSIKVEYTRLGIFNFKYKNEKIITHIIYLELLFLKLFRYYIFYAYKFWFH